MTTQALSESIGNSLLCSWSKQLNQIFVTFLSDLFFLFYVQLLLTPLITASYLVASSQARSYGRLKTTCSDRLTWKNRLGREVGDSRCNPGMQRSNDLVLCCNNANPVAIVINSSIQISIFLLFSCMERKKRLIHAWRNNCKKMRWNESARF